MGIFDEDEKANMFLNGDGGGDDDVDLRFAKKLGRTLEDIEYELLKGLLTNLGHVNEITLRNIYEEVVVIMIVRIRVVIVLVECIVVGFVVDFEIKRLAFVVVVDVEKLERLLLKKLLES
nr:hypothetical protein [Tanacetum cinerariifolium]